MRVSFVTPSTSCAISGPNFDATSSLVTTVSSTTSCKMAAGDRRAVHLHVGEDARDGERMGDVLFPGSPLLAVVRGVGELVDVAQQRIIGSRVVRVDLIDEGVYRLRRHQLTYNAIDVLRVSIAPARPIGH